MRDWRIEGNSPQRHRGHREDVICWGGLGWRGRRGWVEKMSRREEIRKKRTGIDWLMETVVWGIILLVFLILAAKGVQDVFHDRLPDFQLNLSTEILGVIAGAGFSAMVIDRIYAYRNWKELQRRLIREAGSRSNDIAISAVEWMRREGWLKGDDGLLQGALLDEANLENAHLGGANLRKSILTGARLKSANLWRADLTHAELLGTQMQGANLLMAVLERADLSSAHLQEANLMQANLYDADLRSADLTKACLKLANLRCVKLTGANLVGARFDGAFMRDVDTIGVDFRGATMPDGTPAYEAGSDVRKFVDPSHSEFDKALEDVRRVRRELGLIE